MKYLVILLFWAPLQAQLQGVVVDSVTLAPIEGARVRIQKAEPFTATGSDGRFTLNDSADFPYKLTAGAHGYYNGVTIVDASSDLLNLVIEMHTYSTNVDPVIDLLNPNTCEGCHPQKFLEWSETPMRKTGLNTWVFDLYDGSGTAGGLGGFVYQRDSVHFPSNYNSDCSACHSPVHWLKTFEIEPPVQTMGSLSDVNADMANGVQCEVCHRAYDVDINQTYVPGVQPETFHLLNNEEPVQLGLLGDSTYEDTLGQVMRPAYNPQLSAQLCSACHEDTVDHDDDGDFSPADGSPPHESTFSEWQAWQNLSPDNDRSCVDCHMPTTDETHFCAFEGGRRAGTIHSHDIRGTTPEFLENAVTMDVQSSVGLRQVDVDVTVRNDMTGHAVPSGVVVRNMILLLLARDEQGDLLTLTTGDLVDFIGGSGDLDEGYYAGMPGKSFYRNMSRGTDEGLFYTEADSIASDTRIQPGQAYQGSFRYMLPASLAENVDLEVKLVYRRAFRAVVDAKQWTETGHGEPLADIQPPHFGHLMEYQQVVINPCSSRDLNGSGSVDLVDFTQLAASWTQPAPFGVEEEPTTNVKHMVSLVNCLVTARVKK